MTKGQFAMLTAVLGVATMGGAGYIAYASTTPSSHDTTSNRGAASGGQQGGSSASGGGTVALPGGAASADGSAGAVAQCANGDVKVAEGQGQGAAGTISVVLTFQNVSGHRCSLYGYPGASIVGPAGEDLLDAKRTRTGSDAMPTVVLDAGGQASAVLQWSDVQTSAVPGGCAVQNAVNLMVTPPNFTQSTTFSLGKGTEVCSGFEIHQVLTGVSADALSDG
jgi:hypothetical protein